MESLSRYFSQQFSEGWASSYRIGSLCILGAGKEALLLKIPSPTLRPDGLRTLSPGKEHGLTLGTLHSSRDLKKSQGTSSGTLPTSTASAQSSEVKGTQKKASI